MRLKGQYKAKGQLAKQALYRQPEALKSKGKVTFKEICENSTRRMHTDKKFTLCDQANWKQVRTSIEAPQLLDPTKTPISQGQASPKHKRRRAKLSWNADDIHALQNHICLTARSSRQVSYKRLNTQPA